MALLVVLAVGALPLWDTWKHAKMLLALASAAGAPPPDGIPGLPSGLGWSLAALTLGLTVARGGARSRRLSLIAAALLSVGYAVPTFAAATCRISEVEWSLSACSEWDATQQAWFEEQRAQGRVFDPPRYVAGPYLPTGEPCRAAAEEHERYAHPPRFPACVFDGTAVIARRWTDERGRAFGGTGAVLLALAGAAMLERRTSRGPSSPADEKSAA